MDMGKGVGGIGLIIPGCRFDCVHILEHVHYRVRVDHPGVHVLWYVYARSHIPAWKGRTGSCGSDVSVAVYSNVGIETWDHHCLLVIKLSTKVPRCSYATGKGKLFSLAESLIVWWCCLFKAESIWSVLIRICTCTILYIHIWVIWVVDNVSGWTE